MVLFLNCLHLLQENHAQLKARELTSVSEAALRCSWNCIRRLHKHILAGYTLASYLPCREALFHCAGVSGAGAQLHAALQFLTVYSWSLLPYSTGCGSDVDSCQLERLLKRARVSSSQLARGGWWCVCSDGERAKQRWCLDQGRFCRLHGNSSEIVFLFIWPVCQSTILTSLGLEKNSFCMLLWPWGNSIPQPSFFHPSLVLQVLPSEAEKVSL